VFDEIHTALFVSADTIGKIFGVPDENLRI
jgi:hypothetical protein